MFTGMNYVKESGKKIQEIQKPEKLGYVGALAEIATILYKKGETIEIKRKIINEWIERDRRLQGKYDNTPEPENIFW
jgi:hypothetical protein